MRLSKFSPAAKVRAAARWVVLVAVGKLVCRLVLVWAAARAVEARMVRIVDCIVEVLKSSTGKT